MKPVRGPDGKLHSFQSAPLPILERRADVEKLARSDSMREHGGELGDAVKYWLPVRPDSLGNLEN